MKEIIKTIIYEWEERKLPSALNRGINLLDYIDIKPKKIIAITGFRRVGKTYLIFQLITHLFQKKSRTEILYINFEDERIPQQREFLTKLLPTVREVFDKVPEFLFLDEIQNIPNWSKWLRRIHDTENIKIFVTGSSSKVSSREIPTELRGRCIEVNVFPLSLEEFLNFKGIKINFKIIDYSENERARMFKNLNEYLNYGGLPEVVLTSEEMKREILSHYYATVLRRDIIERFKIKNEEALKAMLRLLLNSTYYSISRLYNNLKSSGYAIGKTTLQHYISAVESSYFMFSVPIFSPKIKSQLQYPRKVYFIDNGFINILSVKFSKSFGRLYENAVFVHLLRSKGSEMEIYYWRDKQNKYEVDFVVKQGLKVVQLIQVCYDIADLDTKKREVRALLKASRELKCNDLLIITEDYDTEEMHTGKKIKFTPLWKWLLKTTR
jgi:hypothetical protein